MTCLLPHSSDPPPLSSKPAKKVKKTKEELKQERIDHLRESIFKPDPEGQPGETPVVALDCEMVGTGKDDYSALARVSIVNFYGYVFPSCFPINLCFSE